ncbi:MAG: glycosyltransferase [Gloeomargarita sp. SRBZ-1_bins_9]
MRIFISTFNLDSSFLGQYSLLKCPRDLATLLSASGHQVTLFTFSDNLSQIQRITPGGYEEVILPREVGGYEHLSAVTSLSYRLAEAVIEYIGSNGKPDIIESQNFLALPYFLMQRKLQGESLLDDVPIVLTLYNSLYQIRDKELYPRWQLPYWWHGCLEKWCILAADGIVAPSQFILEQTRKDLEIDLSNAGVIPFPYLEESDVALRTFRSTPTPRDIIYVDSYQLSRGTLQMLEACQNLWETGWDFKLTMIGEDMPYYIAESSMKDYISQKYSKYIERGLLVLEETFPKPELLNRIARSWCVLIPSLFEAFSLACIEAMLLGKVVLASTNGHMREMIFHGENCTGFLFDWDKPGDFADKLEQVLSLSIDENLMIGERARQSALQMISPERTVTMRLEYFQSVINKGRRICLYPSLNYRPIGRMDYPQKLELVGVPGQLSVGILCFNEKEEALWETLDSLAWVSYENLEIIILDNSSDNTVNQELLSDLAKVYDNLTILRTKFLNIAQARNYLAQATHGEFLTFLKSGDTVHPDYYRDAVKILQRYLNVASVGTWVICPSHVLVTWNNEMPMQLYYGMAGEGFVMRKSVFQSIGGFKFDLADSLSSLFWDFLLSVTEKGWLNVVIAKPYYSSCGSDADHRYLRMKVRQKVVEYHKQLFQVYGDEVIGLCVQNHTAPLYCKNLETPWYVGKINFSKMVNEPGLY